MKPGPRRPRAPGRDYARRGLPPESTGREPLYLQRRKDARTPMAVTLTNGTVVHGVIEYFDHEMVKLTRLKGPHVFVRKSDIRYMHERSEG